MLPVLDLLQLSVGKKRAFYRAPSPAEWEALYGISRRHGMLGVLAGAVEFLHEAQKPPRKLLFAWVAGCRTDYPTKPHGQ